MASGKYGMQRIYRTGARAGVLMLGLLAVCGLSGCASGTAWSQPLANASSGDSAVPLASTAAGLSHLSKNDTLLVVITYGCGCSAEGDGNGLRKLAEGIRKLHPNERVITRGWDDADGIVQTVENHPGPVALLGHSFGGCRSVELASKLHRAVDWLILLDPVPCDDWGLRHAGKYFKIPACVTNAVCFYRPAGFFPVSYPIVDPNQADENRLRDWSHNEFCKDSEVHQFVLGVCQKEEMASSGLAGARTSSTPAVPGRYTLDSSNRGPFPGIR
jgi:pimeloyl-ACP methyl ester carboxylesterase